MLSGAVLSAAAGDVDSVTIGFRRSHIDVDTAYACNGHRLDSIFSILSATPPDGRHRVLTGIRVLGAASPEGSEGFNRYLSEKRAQAIFNLFRTRGLIPDSVSPVSQYLGRDWQGLRRGVEGDAKVPYRPDVLSLLDGILDKDASPAISHPLSRLKAIHGGRPYRYLDAHIFPGLRKSQIVLEYEDIYGTLAKDLLVPPTTLVTYPMPEPLPLRDTEVWKVCKPFYMGLKTNLLYDALLLPNIGAEFYIGKNWSITADWIYGWWDKDSAHRYWRLYGGYLGARRWFGKKAAEKPLTGHHLGIFAGAITYDFEFGGEGIMGGKPHGTLWERCNFIGGIEYGYSLPIARRLNLDFSIAFGYIGGKYYKYVPYNGFYLWQSTHRLNYVGPTKVEVSLVWLIGCGNFNNRRARK